MKTKNKINKKGAMALSQIMILLIGMIAISWAIGGGIGVVSAGAVVSCDNGKGKCIDINEENCVGEIKIGLCPGGNNIRCCVPKVEEPRRESNVNVGGAVVQKPNEEAPTTPAYDFTDYISDNGDGTYTVDEEGIKNNPDLGQTALTYLTNSLLGKGFQYGERLLTKEGSKVVGKETTKKTAEEVVKNPKFWENHPVWSGGISAVIGWAAMNAVLKYIANQNERNLKAAQSLWTGGSAFIVGAIVGKTTALAFIGITNPIVAGFIIGALIVTAVWSISANVFSQDIISYKVSVWQPVYGGRECEKCNDLEYGCSEYQCKTFGKSCEIINPGSEYALCAWDGEGDMTPPIISILENVLDEEFEYKKFENKATSPPERGIKIIDSDGEENCLPAFSSFTFGIQTDEYAYCRWDYLRQPNFESMPNYLDEGGFATINHTMFIPNTATASTEALESAGLSIEEGRNYDFFIKCADRNGNENPLHFLVSFCVEEGPDTDAPIIKGTSYDDISYISYNQSSVNLDVYTNEPATCKWDHADLDYEQMNYNMSECSLNVKDYLHNKIGVYGCSGELTGIKNYAENIFYIRCKDKPWWDSSMEGEQFANEKSYVLTLQGTKSLYIDEVTINDKKSGAIIKDSSNEISATLKVKTSSGAEEGKAMCDYSSDNVAFYNFYNGGSNNYLYENIQKLYFGLGQYNYYIKCSDVAGNSDTAEINFTIETDREAPIIVRAFHESNYLKIITNEKAECVYSLDNCNYEFEDGLEMMTSNNLEHSETWDTNKEYNIKCKDEYNNQPYPNECSLVVRPSEF